MLIVEGAQMYCIQRYAQASTSAFFQTSDSQKGQSEVNWKKNNSKYLGV